MKKILSTILAASMMLIGAQAFAQVSVGAGYLNSTTRTKVNDNITTVPSNGFYVGGDYTITEGKGFGISAGAYYTYLANETSKSGSIFGIQIGGSAKTTEMYLDIPVNFNLSTDLGSSLKGFVYAGPTFSLGLSSMSEASGSIAGIGGTKKIDNYENENYNRFDILVGGGVGVDYNQIRIKAGYNLGMLNRYNTENYTVNRNVLHVGISYIF